MTVHYVVLATKAIPEGKSPNVLLEMTVSEWEKAVKLVDSDAVKKP